MTDGTNPNQLSAGHTPAPRHAAGQPPVGPESDVSQQCVDVTEDFRKGDLSKLQAFLSIQSIVAAEELAEDITSQTLDFYLNLLDIIETEREKAAEIGDSQGANGESQPTPAAQKRPRAEHRPEDESDNEDKNRSPCKKIDTDLFAWTSRTSSIQLSPDLEETRIALENFTRDPVFARNSITSQPDCPAYSFEDWDDLVRGKPAKFNHIFSSIHATTLDERQSQKLGDIEFKFGSHIAGRLVSSHGEWSITFDRYARAVECVLPHRSGELRLYRDHISQLFASLPAHFHDRVFNYDKAVRLCVSQTRSHLLSNFAAFTDLSLLWLQAPSWTGNTQSKPAKGSTSSNHRRDPCRRYNNKKCPNTSQTCNYKHICSNCQSNNHSQVDCPKAN
jgi:hypothetical protein